jgi:hypothetical protein
LPTNLWAVASPVTQEPNVAVSRGAYQPDHPAWSEWPTMRMLRA